jgi:hypothetical protein
MTRHRRLAATRAAVAGPALAALLLAGGCTDPDTDAPPAPRPPDRAIELRLPLAEGDVAQPAPPVTLGPLQMDVLAARCGILAITGTHAEFIPDQPLCRARLRVVSADSSSHSFSTREQLLVLDDGTTVGPSRDAMLIKRQADRIELGARNAVELDVWWTVPAGRKPAAVRLVGDREATPLGPTPAASSADVPLAGV